MPHPDEAKLIIELEDWNISAANEFKKCIEIAKEWRRRTNLQDESGDVFSNVMNNSGCNANLKKILSSKPNLLQRAQNCLNYYKNQ